MKKIFVLIGFCIYIIALVGCHSRSDKNHPYNYILEPSGSKIALALDKETVAESFSLFGFVSKDGGQYLTFLNEFTNSILFFNIDNQRLENKIAFTRDGPTSTGNVRGFTVINRDSILVTISGRTLLYLVNGKGDVIKKIDFTQTSKKEPLLFSDGYSFFYSPVVFTNGKLYLTQEPILRNNVCIEIDLKTDSIKLLPMQHPIKDNGFIENNMFCRDFNGKEFIYSFRNSHDIYITPDHKSFYRRLAKSDEINKIIPMKFNGVPTIEEGRIAIIEHSQYRSIVYDSYRKVYYRFAYPGVSLEGTDNIKILSKYYKKFSIIILDKAFNKIGEYFTPENVYNINMFFLGKDGLYLSTNHILNKDYDENKLTFELLRLKKINN